MVEGSSPARPSPTVLKMWAESQPSPGGMSEHAAPLYIDYESLRRRMQLAGYGITMTPSVSEFSLVSGPADNYSIYSTPAPSVLASPPGSPSAFGAQSPPESSLDFSISPVVPSHAVNVSASSTASRASAASRQRQQPLGGTRPSAKPRVLDFDTLVAPPGEKTAAHPGNPASIWPFNQAPYRPSESPPMPQPSADASVSSLGSTDIFMSLQRIAGGPLWDKALVSHRPMSSQQSSMRGSVDNMSLSQMGYQTMASAAPNQDQDSSSTHHSPRAASANAALWGEPLKSRPPASYAPSSAAESYTDSVIHARSGRSFDSCESRYTQEGEVAKKTLDLGEPLWGSTLAGHAPLSSVPSTEYDARSAFGGSQDTSGFLVLQNAEQEPVPDAKGPEEETFKNYLSVAMQQQQRQQQQQRRQRVERHGDSEPLWGATLAGHAPRSSIPSECDAQSMFGGSQDTSGFPVLQNLEQEPVLQAKGTAEGPCKNYFSVAMQQGAQAHSNSEPLWGSTLAGHAPLSSIPSEYDARSAFGGSQDTSGFPVLQNAEQEPAPDAKGLEEGTFKNYFLAMQQQQQQRVERYSNSSDVSESRSRCGVVPEEEEVANPLDAGAPLWGSTLAGHAPLSSIPSECDAQSMFGGSQDTPGFPALLNADQEPVPHAEAPEEGPFKNYFFAVQQQQQQQHLEGPQQAAPSAVAPIDLVSSLQSWTAVVPYSGGAAATPRAVPEAEADTPPHKGSEVIRAVQSVDVHEAGDRPRGPEYWKGRAEYWASRTEASDPPSPLHASLPALPAAGSAPGSPSVSTSGGHRLPKGPKDDLRQQVILLSASRVYSGDLSEDSGSPVKAHQAPNSSEPTTSEAALADASVVCSETMSTTAFQSEDVSLSISSFADDSKAAMETSSSTAWASSRLEPQVVSLSPEKSESPSHITPRGQSDPLSQKGILSPDDVEVLSKAVKEVQGEITAKPQSGAQRAALVAKYSQLQAEFLALQEKAINDPILRSSVNTPRQVFEGPPSAAAATHSPDMNGAVKQQKATVAKEKVSSPRSVGDKVKSVATPVIAAVHEPPQPKGCFVCFFNR